MATMGNMLYLPRYIMSFRSCHIYIAGYHGFWGGCNLLKLLSHEMALIPVSELNGSTAQVYFSLRRALKFLIFAPVP
jgi:hypothetical protein